MRAKESNWPWEARSYFDRFRLDDQGIAPDGVGQDESTPPFSMRASLQINPSLRVEAIAGAVFGGMLRLEDEDGNRIEEQDYDIAPFLGIFGSVTF